MSARVLVVDDEPMVVDVVERYLRREGYEVQSAYDGHAALAAHAAFRPHLMVLDLMLPGVDGLEICRTVRGTHPTAVIMLTARGDEMDRIAGFEVGADDYLAKPFSPRELVMRVRAVLRRAGEIATGSAEPPLVAGDLVLDPRARTATRSGAELGLTQREFDLLWFLATHPNEVFPRERLLECVWGERSYADPSTVTVHVRRLRTKIEPFPEEPTRLVTVWGVGYRWSP